MVAKAREEEEEDGGGGGSRELCDDPDNFR